MKFGTFIKISNILKKLLLSFFIIGLICSIYATANANYRLALSPMQEQEVGKEFMDKLLQSGKVIIDPVINEYIQALGHRLLAHSNTPQRKIKFFVLNSASLNAFAAPGGYIGVNAGLLTYVSNEDELAAVLAHEIAHVSQRHLAHMLQHAKATRTPTLAASLAAIAIGIVNPALGAGTLALVSAGYQQDLINFTRANEKEADRLGMKTLYKAEFNPMSMPLLFEDLGRAMRLYPNDIPEILRTHPYDKSRIADSLNRARLYPKKKYHQTLEFLLIQAKLRVDTNTDKHTLVNYYRNTKKKASSLKNTAHQYGYALALIKVKQYQTAKKY